MAVYTSPTVNDFEELNSWLADQCLAISKKRNHPDNKEHSIYRVFQDEQPSLIPTCVPFNGYSEKECRVSKTGLVGFDRNHYSVRLSGNSMEYGLILQGLLYSRETGNDSMGVEKKPHRMKRTQSYRIRTHRIGNTTHVTVR